MNFVSVVVFLAVVVSGACVVERKVENCCDTVAWLDGPLVVVNLVVVVEGFLVVVEVVVYLVVL